MLAREQLLQHVKTKHKKPKRSRRRKLHGNAHCSGAWTQLLYMRGLRFIVRECFQFSAFPKEANFSTVLCILNKFSHQAKAVQAQQPLHASSRAARVSPELGALGHLRRGRRPLCHRGSLGLVLVRSDVPGAQLLTVHHENLSETATNAATNSKRRKEQWLLLRSSHHSSSSI